ncbi:MAG TPA: hypothetical protein VE619_05900 [Nitrososphaeraceae archaeon]|nr:hypothetical protein [Nitrososphaeraceae archaeon]
MNRGNGNSDNNSNSKWLLNNILSFLQAQKERAERKRSQDILSIILKP